MIFIYKSITPGGANRIASFLGGNDKVYLLLRGLHFNFYPKVSDKATCNITKNNKVR